MIKKLAAMRQAGHDTFNSYRASAVCKALSDTLRCEGMDPIFENSALNIDFMFNIKIEKLTFLPSYSLFHMLLKSETNLLSMFLLCKNIRPKGILRTPDRGIERQLYFLRLAGRNTLLNQPISQNLL